MHKGRVFTFMEILNGKIKLLYHAIHVIALTVAIVLLCNHFLELKVHIIAIILSASMIYLLFAFVSYNKKNLYTYLFLIGLIFCVGLFVFVQNINILQRINEITRWFIQYEKMKDNYQVTYAFIIIFSIIIFISLFFYLLIRNLIFRYIFAAGLLLALIFFAIGDMEVNKLSLAIFIFFMINETLEFCNFIFYKKDEEHQMTIIYMLPLCAMIGIISVSIPSKTEPIQWKVVKQFAHFVGDKMDDVSFYLTSLNLSENYEVAFLGYSNEEKGFFDNVNKERERIILKIDLNVKKSNSIYLIGHVSDKYTKIGWEKSNIDYGTKDEPSLDFKQMLIGFYQYNVKPRESEILFKNNMVEIAYHKIKTTSVFYPLKMYRLEAKKDFYDSSTPNLQGDKPIKRGLKYEVSYYDINYESDSIKDYLRDISKTDGNTQILEDRSFDVNKFNFYLEETFNNSYLTKYPIEDNFSELVKERTWLIKQYFTKLPEAPSTRVVDLANELTKDYDNNYDKLKAIEGYLSTYTYTLSPPKMMEGEDFVDSFLFKEKEGYCTYFATAMAVLGRCIDIPTRYVEGVVVDYEDYDGRNYLIKNDSSHAWVEAYFEGFGWVPFEPTPGRYSNRFSVWADKKTTGVASYSSPIEWNQVPPEEEVKQQAIQREYVKRTRYMLNISLIIILGICFLFTCFILILRYSKNKRFQNATSNEKARYLLRDILKYLKAEGHDIILGETLYDFAGRVNNVYDFDIITLKEVFIIYNDIRYSGKEIEYTDLKQILLYYECLKRYMKKNLRWNEKLKYYLSSIVYK